MANLSKMLSTVAGAVGDALRTIPKKLLALVRRVRGMMRPNNDAVADIDISSIDMMEVDDCPESFDEESGEEENEEGGNEEEEEDMEVDEIPVVLPANRCYICDKIYCSRGNLKRHLVIHSGNKPFACEICKAAFTQKAHLKRHVKMSHEKVKKHICAECTADFYQLADFQRHLLVHTGEKPFACDICGKAFALNGNLTEHKTIHDENPARPFVCPYCKKAFRVKKVLKAHLKNIHRKEGTV